MSSFQSKSKSSVVYYIFLFKVTEWISQCENARALLQSKDQKDSDQPLDAVDGLSSLTKGKSDKKSPKLFSVVSKLVLRSNSRNSLSPEKK